MRRSRETPDWPLPASHHPPLNLTPDSAVSSGSFSSLRKATSAPALGFRVDDDADALENWYHIPLPPPTSCHNEKERAPRQECSGAAQGKRFTALPVPLEALCSQAQRINVRYSHAAAGQTAVQHGSDGRHDPHTGRLHQTSGAKKTHRRARTETCNQYHHDGGCHTDETMKSRSLRELKSLGSLRRAASQHKKTTKTHLEFDSLLVKPPTQHARSCTLPHPPPPSSRPPPELTAQDQARTAPNHALRSGWYSDDEDEDEDEDRTTAAAGWVKNLGLGPWSPSGRRDKKTNNNDKGHSRQSSDSSVKSISRLLLGRVADVLSGTSLLESQERERRAERLKLSIQHPCD